MDLTAKINFTKNNMYLTYDNVKKCLALSWKTPYAPEIELEQLIDAPEWMKASFLEALYRLIHVMFEQKIYLETMLGVLCVVESTFSSQDDQCDFFDYYTDLADFVLQTVSHYRFEDD